MQVARFDRRRDARCVTSAPSKELTPQRLFRPIILAEIARQGGEATAPQVYAAVERELRGRFRPGDLELLSRGKMGEAEPRWRNAVRQEVRAMRDDGTLVRGRHGVWATA